MESAASFSSNNEYTDVEIGECCFSMARCRSISSHTSLCHKIKDDTVVLFPHRLFQCFCFNGRQVAVGMCGLES